MIPEATIGVVSTRGFVGGAIRLATRSHESHVILADGHGGCWEAQAGHGVRHLDTVPYTDLVWLTRLPITDFQRCDAAAYCQAEALNHTRYNYPAIAVFAERTFFDWAPQNWLERWADNRPNQICSELAVNALRSAHLDLFPGRLAATVSPGDIGNLALEKGWT